MPTAAAAWGSFPTRKAADQAVRRLISDGFARNSIDLHRHDEDPGYDIVVHTRHRNLGRVERLMHMSAPAYALRTFGMGALRNVRAHPMALLGAGLVAGIVVYGLIGGRPLARAGTHSKARMHSRASKTHGRHQ